MKKIKLMKKVVVLHCRFWTIPVSKKLLDILAHRNSSVGIKLLAILDFIKMRNGLIRFVQKYLSSFG